MYGNVGYIFNKYEIAYISEMMGASSIINIGIKFNEPPEVISAKAKESLIRKNYVFRNFSGELVLNKEFVNFFKPFVSPEGMIACRKFIGGTEINFMFFTKNKEWLCVENYILIDDSYILTYSNEYALIIDSFNEILTSNFQKDTIGIKLEMDMAQYNVIKDMARKNDKDGFISVIGMIDADLDEEIISELEKICLDNADVLSIVFCGDYKNNPIDMKCLIYYPTNKYVWKIDVKSKDAIVISDVSEKDIKKDILSMLNKEFEIPEKKWNEMLR